MTSFISHGFPNTVQGGVARKTDTQAQLQKDGSEVGPAEGVAVHVREAPSVPRWERGLEAAGPKDLAEPSLSQTGTGECWPSSGSARRWLSAGSHTHAQGREPSNQPLESGFIVFFKKLFPPFDPVFTSEPFLGTVVSYGSERVVASQRTNGWTPRATM